MYIHKNHSVGRDTITFIVLQVYTCFDLFVGSTLRFYKQKNHKSSHMLDTGPLNPWALRKESPGIGRLYLFRCSRGQCQSAGPRAHGVSFGRTLCPGPQTPQANHRAKPSNDNKKKKRLLLPFIAALVHRLLCACTGTGSNVCTGARTGRVRGDFKEMERHLQELYFQHVLVQLYDLTCAKMFPLTKLFISNPNITILTIASFGSVCLPGWGQPDRDQQCPSQTGQINLMAIFQ